jgi:hypothetical protein
MGDRLERRYPEPIRLNLARHRANCADHRLHEDQILSATTRQMPGF